MAKTWLSPDGTRELRWDHYRLDSFSERVYVGSLRAHPGDRVLVEWEEDVLRLLPGWEGRVFFTMLGLDHTLAVRSLEDGHVLRELGTGRLLGCLPGDELVFAEARERLTAFEVETGAVRWTLQDGALHLAPGYRELVRVLHGRWQRGSGVSPTTIEVFDVQAGTSLWRRTQAAVVEELAFSTEQRALVVRSKDLPPAAFELATGRSLEPEAAVKTVVPRVEWDWPPSQGTPRG